MSMLEKVAIASFNDEMEKLSYSGLVGFSGGALGALTGAAAGAATAKKGERGKAAKRGALAGGAIGAGVGALRGKSFSNIAKKMGHEGTSRSAMTAKGSNEMLEAAQKSKWSKGVGARNAEPLIGLGAGSIAGGVTHAKKDRKY